MSPVAADPAVLRRRLLSLAKARQLPPAALLPQLLQNALLQRLQRSSQAANLSLKGAARLTVLLGPPARLTANLDLQQNHQRLAVDEAALRAALQEICRPSPLQQQDGLQFLADRLGLLPRRSPYGYDDVQVSLPVLLGHRRHLLLLHVAAHPAPLLTPQPCVLPSLVDGLYSSPTGAPTLRAISTEQVAAEKLHVLHQAEAPGMPPLCRLQDLEDLRRLAAHAQLSGGPLMAALRQIFEHRQTPLPRQLPALLRAAAPPPLLAASWAHYAARLRPAVALDLAAVGAAVRQLLTPLYAALGRNHNFFGFYAPERGWGNKA